MASGCKDRHRNCVMWSRSGECNRNKFWMAENCRQSCNRCGFQVLFGLRTFYHIDRFSAGKDVQRRRRIENCIFGFMMTSLKMERDNSRIGIAGDHSSATKGQMHVPRLLQREYVLPIMGFRRQVADIYHNQKTK